MTHLLVATRNMHKTREFAQILGDEFRVTDLSDEKSVPAVPETGRTFEENAILKALAVPHSGLVMADDSGLEVDALDGAPGVFSARYAGEEASDKENVEKLLLELAGRNIGPAERAARFRCVIALARDGKLLRTFAGIAQGVIVDAPRGAGGFGYDPIFLPVGSAKTFGELPPEIKNQMSHRAKAIEALRAYLRSNKG